MMKLVIVSALLSLANAGVVEYTRCGGIGTFKQLRIEGCEGALCYMAPGYPYACEGDLIPSSAAPSLTLKVTATFLGTTVPILEAVLADSSVQPGLEYTIKFNIVPNDILAGEFLNINAEVLHTDNQRIEICVYFGVRILELL